MQDRDFEELQRIWDLKQKGAISKEEYVRLKDGVLANSGPARAASAADQPGQNTPIVNRRPIATGAPTSSEVPRGPSYPKIAGVGCLVLTALFVIVALVGPRTSSTDQNSASKGQTVFKHLSTTESRCGGGGIATNDDVGVMTTVDLLVGPASKKRVVNEKSSSILGHTDYQQLDPTERLRELCRQPLWAKVQVKEPDWLTDVIGWVPVKMLRPIQHDNSGARVFTPADFVWESDTAPYRSQLVAAVNKIVRENDRCHSVDPGTLLKDPDSKSKEPTFFITCNEGPDAFNVFFKPSDVARGRHFVAPANISAGVALVLCESAAREAATNPHTVSFSKFWDLAFVPYPNGNSRLLSTFTAKNAFGVEGKFNIECFFQGSDLTERSISMAGD